MTTNESPNPGRHPVSGNNIAGHSQSVTQKPQDRSGPLPERELRATPSGPGPHNTCHHDEHDPNGTAATVCACIVLLVLLALATLGALWLAGNLP